jgi:hypothetical protein
MSEKWKTRFALAVVVVGGLFIAYVLVDGNLPALKRDWHNAFSSPSGVSGPTGPSGTTRVTRPIPGGDSGFVLGTPRVITAAEAPSFLGETKTVRFHVGYTYTDSDGTEFLDQYQNYSSGFIVTIFASDLAHFSVDPASTYGGDTVDVTGTISTYNGYCEILNPTSIAVASD